MKALTSILMLCLPVAAMGEIYVCRSESSSVAISPDSRFFSGDLELTDFIVDTESGIRTLTDESTYLGECKTPEGFTAIACSYENTISSIQVYIDNISYTFTYSAHLYGSYVRSFWGKCTEI